MRLGLDKIYAYGCRVVNFTGGEPTLRHDLEEIVSHASSLGMWTSVVTNGSLMTRERLGMLKAAGLDNLFVSLDSTSAEVHDAHRGIEGLHAKVTDCMNWLSSDFLTGHRTGGVMFVLSKANIDLAETVVTYADDLGVYVVFQPYHENKTGASEFTAEITPQTIKTLLELKRSRNNILNSDRFIHGLSQPWRGEQRQLCHAGKKYFSIDPYGYLHACVDLPIAGHILETDISVVRAPQAMSHVETCKGCWYCFRGEADSALSYMGCFEKLELGLGVFLRNSRRRFMSSEQREQEALDAELVQLRDSLELPGSLLEALDREAEPQTWRERHV